PGIRLSNGKVFVPNSTTSQIFDPTKGTWSAAKPAPAAPLGSAGAAVLLRDGRVLVIGEVHNAVTDAMLYDPSTDSWGNGGNLIFDRANNPVRLLLLKDGRVLMVDAVAVHQIYMPPK